MPSLPTANNNVRSSSNAFRWYLPCENDIPFNTHYMSLKFVISAFLLSLLILGIDLITLYWRVSNNNDFYYQFKLYFVHELYRTICWSLFGYQFYTLLHFQSHKLHIAYITFLSFIVINYTILSVLAYLFHAVPSFPTGVLFCNYIHCAAFDPYHVYLYGVGISFSMITGFIMIKYFTNEKKEIIVEYVELIDIEHQKDIANDVHINLDGFDINTSNKSLFYHQLSYFFIIMFYLEYLHLLENIRYDTFNNNTTNLYIMLLLVTITIKFILKRIARNIDVIRISKYYYYVKMNHITDNKQLISMEMITELLISCMYWFVFRYLLVFDSASWHTFILLKTFHLTSEIFQYVVRSSMFYYRLTLKLYHKYKNNKCWTAFNVFYKMLEDDSTYIQWNKRHLIDIYLRFLSSLFTAILIGLTFVADKNWLLRFIGIDNEQLVYRATYMTFISMLIDAIFFICIGLINKHCYNTNFGICHVFDLLFSVHKYRLMIVFCAVFIVSALHTLG